MIALAADHGGYELKEDIKKYLDKKNIPYVDTGCFSKESVDYPDVVKPALAKVVSNEAEKAILFCGTGIGVSIAANKTKGIRACVCSETFSAEFTRKHNDSNTLCLGGRVVGTGLAIEIVKKFLNTEFEGGRHERRVEKLMEIEKNK